MIRTLRVVFFLLLPLSLSATQQTYTAAVVGFNPSDSSSPALGVSITRSFITYFSQMPGVKVVPFAVSDKLARERGFERAGKTLPEKAVEIAQALGARQALAGTYTLNESANTITIDVTAVDTVTGEVRFQRRYEGKAGVELLDTIETARRNAAGLLTGKPVPSGTLVIETAQGKGVYAVRINSQAEGHAAPRLKRDYVAAVPLEVELIETNSGLSVLKTNLTLKNKETVTLTYTPAATLLVQSELLPVQVWENGHPVMVLSNSGPLTIGGKPAGALYKYFLQNETRRSWVREVSFAEGRMSLLSFSSNDFHARLRYRGLTPAWNLLVPGLVQFQANDMAPGFVFAGLGALDIGLAVTAFMVYGEAQNRINTTQNATYAEQLKPYRDISLAGGIAGCALWGGLALGAFFHAWGMQSAEELDSRFEAGFTDHGWELKWTVPVGMEVSCAR